jgi:uncharacterized alpha-E superfamily protein
MLTRIAGNCFWMARLLERAENNVRLLRMASLHAALPEYQDNPIGLWQTALEVGGTLDDYRERIGAVERQAVLRYMVLDRDNASGIVTCMRQARDNARTARHLLTELSWEVINDTWIQAQALDEARLADHGVEGVASWATQRLRLIQGALLDLWRDALPHVLELGEGIERADFTARILAEILPGLLADGLDAPPVGSPLFRRWQGLLTGLGLTETWRRSTPNAIVPLEVLRLVLLHPHAPQSLLLNVRRMADAIGGATGRNDGRAFASCRRLEGTILAADLEQLATAEDDEGMPWFLTTLTSMTNDIGARLMTDHFA